MASTVIIGAGIIGVSTAYYLSEHQPASTIHLVEAAPGLFSSASGFAAGFIAKDWYAPEVASLGALSFEQHRLLAERHGGKDKWGYSPSNSFSYSPGPGGGLSEAETGDRPQDGTSRSRDITTVIGEAHELAPSWLRRRDGDRLEVISGSDATGQVDPLRLCQFLVQECLDRGVQLHHPARTISVNTDTRNELASIRIADLRSSAETDIPCPRVIVAAGAWSPRVFESLFRGSQYKLPISNLAGHSVVLSSPVWAGEFDKTGSRAIFAAGNGGYSPELFSRAGGEVYIAGLNSSSIPLPETAGESTVRETAIAHLMQTASEMLRTEEGGDGNAIYRIERKGLCFRPVTNTGKPIISRISDRLLGSGIKTRSGADGGVYLAAGHGPWGISLGIGTGMVLAEMVQGRSVSADISALSLSQH